MSAANDVLPSLRFRLPGTWAQIPLHNATEAKAAIHKLVARQVGGGDEAATAREQLRRQLNDALKDAIDGDAQSMQVALEIIEGLPVPASFTVFLPQQRITPAIGTDPAGVIAILEQGLRGRVDVDVSTLQSMQTSESAVLRTHRVQDVEVEAGVEPIPVLVVDYWMTIPGTKRFLLINFHTALADAAAEMLTLFDSIVRASFWRHPEQAAAAREIA